MNFYVNIKNLFIQEGLKSILLNKYPSYALNMIDSIDDLNTTRIGDNPVLILDNFSDILGNQSKIKNLVIKKMMKTVLIANMTQIEQMKRKDLDMVDGLIYFDCSFHELHEALEDIMSGIKYRCKRLDNVLNADSDIKRKLESSLITEREIDIIKLVIAGRTSDEIAEKLNISYHTVSTHRKNINKKLNIKTPHDLVRLFMNVNF